MESQLTLQEENIQLRARVSNLEEVLRAIHADEVDAMVSSSQGGQIVSSQNTDFVYRLLIEEMAQGALTLNDEGVVLYANRGFAKLLGRELNTVIGQAVTSFFAPEGQPYLLSLLKTNELTKRSIEIDLAGADGLRTAVMLSTSPMALDGVPGAFSMVVTDLTAKKRTETEVQARDVLLGLIEGQKRAQDDLRANQTALLTSVHDKEALLKEVHHRVKNNLQIINSLLRMEIRRSTIDDTKTVLSDMRGRIQAMAQLHESLYQSDTFASVDFGAYIERLSTLVFQTQGVQNERVRLALNIASVRVSMDQASVGGLLLNELITNCIKHGFPDARTGEVRVSLQPAGSENEVDDQWCLSVSDTGIGIPIDFEERRKVSLGMRLVHDLSKQLGGSLSIESSPDKGAMFRVIFAIQLPTPLVMPP